MPFDVWTNPEKLKHFIRADEPIIDRQYAGIYTWWAEGKGPVVFTKMIQDQELEFTWVFGDEPETKVNIRFDPVEDNTLVTLNHYEFRSPEAVIGYDIGWTSILAELKLVCELGESGTREVTLWGIT
ncbi:MAG: SRPBCC domain-containing protein [Candidatus Thorarchaeota archaeon]